MKRIDMSEKAVWCRLRKVDKLRKLCLALPKAKRIELDAAQNKKPERAFNRIKHVRPPN